ncbi:MAG: hypothetical protein IKV74_01705 [Clostridia bacterium]|nr:hypothetical protein [Clostridia bacterium]
MNKELIRKFSICLALVMLFAVALPGNVLGADSDYEVDLGSLQGESEFVTVRDGYPDALYPEGAYVLQFAGGCGYISLGNMDLSKYNEVVLNVGSSASAVFNNSTGKAFLALTSNGAVKTGNKNDGVTMVTTANILSQKNLSAPAGRWASGEQIVRIPVNSTYSGPVYLAYGPIIRDNNGSPTLDSVVVSKIVFKKATAQEKPPVEQWKDIEGITQYSLVDFEEAELPAVGSSLGNFNADWGLSRGEYFSAYLKEDGTIGGKIDDTNYFQAQYLDAMENRAYVFSFEAQLGSSQFYFYVRGTEPVVRENPAWQEAPIGWYEKDWYKENGGAVPGAVSTMGASGIALTKGNSDSTLALVIKTYEADGILIASRVVNIPVDPEIALGIHTYTIYDNGEGAFKYYVDGALFATVEYAEPTTYDDAWDDDAYAFYKKVTVRDAYGEVLSVVNNTRLSEEGVIAFAFRKMVGTTNLVDQLQISVGPESTPTEAPESTPTEVPDSKTTPPVISTQSPSDDLHEENPVAPVIWPWILAGIVIIGIAIAVVVLVVKRKARKQ